MVLVAIAVVGARIGVLLAHSSDPRLRCVRDIMHSRYLRQQHEVLVRAVEPGEGVLLH